MGIRKRDSMERRERVRGIKRKRNKDRRPVTRMNI